MEMVLYEFLDEHLEAAGITSQTEFFDRLVGEEFQGSLQTVNNWMRGISRPDIKSGEKVAKVLGLSAPERLKLYDLPIEPRPGTKAAEQKAS